jgi:hypothetical protein
MHPSVKPLLDILELNLSWLCEQIVYVFNRITCVNWRKSRYTLKILSIAIIFCLRNEDSFSLRSDISKYAHQNVLNA